MAQPVKPRPYKSPLREQRAQETRKVILDAAERLFTEHGYAATRLADVAEDAGVSLATVKLVFGTKPTLLLNLWHRTMAGGLDDRVPVGERDWARRQAEATDPVERMDLAAENSVLIKSRIGHLVQLIQDAAPADEELAALWTRMQAEHREKSHEFAEQLRQEGSLRPDLDVAEAGDIAWALNHVNVYRIFVDGCGWTPERYRDWLADSMRRSLLGEHPG